MLIYQLSADTGIAPDGTKGASVHLRAIREALLRTGASVQTFCARAPSVPTPGFERFDGAESLIARARSEGSPHAIYERYALGHLGGLDAARRLKCPLVLEVNAPLVDEARAHRPHQLKKGDAEIEARLFREADLIAAVSRPLVQQILEVRGQDLPTLIVRNGCDPSRYPVPADLTTGDPTLVFLGHPKPWHGALRTLEILAKVRAQGLPARLLVIGGGDGAAALEQESTKLGLREALTVTGPVHESEAARLLVCGTISLAPYPRQDPFYFCPLKIIESMAAGVPVVATDQGDIREILGDTGVVVPPEDDAALARAVIELLMAPERARVLGRAARVRAFENLTWDVAARTLASAIKSLRGDNA